MQKFRKVSEGSPVKIYNFPVEIFWVPEGLPCKKKISTVPSYISVAEMQKFRKVSGGSPVGLR